MNLGSLRHAARTVLVGAIAAATVATAAPPASARVYIWEDARAARTFTQAAVDQIGVRYCWGGGDLNGPTPGDTSISQCTWSRPGFDCSGLVHYALGRAGMRLTDRPAHEFSALGTAVPAPVPGDLLFYDKEAPWGQYDHVTIYLGRNWDNNQVEVVEAHGVRGPAQDGYTVRNRRYTPGEARLIKRVFH